MKYNKVFSYIVLVAAFISAATFTSCKSDKESVKVSNISLNEAVVNLSPGGEFQLAVSGVLPANATDKTVTWSSSVSAVATVDPTGLVTVSASATEGETATITATANDGGGARATCTINVRISSVSVGAQDGVLREGTAGSVTFPVTTANIADGAYAATVTNLPTGVSVQGQVTISANAGTLTLAGNVSTTAGTFDNLTLNVDGTVSSQFTLLISDALAKSVEVAEQTSEQVITTGVADEITLSVTTENIDDGQTGTIAWFTDAAGTEPAGSAPVGITAAISNVANNAATVTITATNSVAGGLFYFRVTIDGVTSPVVKLTVAFPGHTGFPDTEWYDSNPAATAFTLTTPDDLAGLAHLVNNGTQNFAGRTVTLGANIDLSCYVENEYSNVGVATLDRLISGAGWIPIGYTFQENVSYPSFQGTFDGAGHTVSNLYIGYDGSQDWRSRGLFGFVYTGGVVKNVGLIMHPNGVSGDQAIGGLVGFARESTISNCYVMGVNIITARTQSGGLAGVVNAATIENCWVAGEVNVSANGGGIVGTTRGAIGATIVRNCVALHSAVNRRSGSHAGFGRIVAEPGGATLDNVAFDGMLRGGGWLIDGPLENPPHERYGIGADTVNGADITKEQIAADGTIGGRFTTANGWTVENGKLPGFGAAIELPAHLR